ncbi:hypothetical protein C7Y66_21735 [Chroococcidiopsis sp. CCALA 051]|uniref:hypothetical protein n=1 Tax=Chroococcidiopsis sp. CCALA 051 TaxID=869949 RepID=UPI000D0E30A2|nr:hypothetical protein [Chroococcidiopsis sp. CCALA 051]MBE9017832.1 hypothetical protein [Chroococcidiopsidales cyanobacterium LEGE 13417]PSM47066.1 hypothetical protein C7Y66_21735 [Chroococcidiopsis sp. CCALA 051]
MPPRITDPVAWQQAELLMQPAFIRIIDHIRKHLDESAWQGTYENVLIWSPDTTEEMKTRVILLLQELDGASPERTAEIEQAIANLPTPQPGYQLSLQNQDQQYNFDLWELCYQVCFQQYNADLTSSHSSVEIDTSLIDETGEVDWQRLDTKAGAAVEQVFSSLPKI